MIFSPDEAQRRLVATTVEQDLLALGNHFRMCGELTDSQRSEAIGMLERIKADLAGALAEIARVRDMNHRQAQMLRSERGTMNDYRQQRDVALARIKEVEQEVARLKALTSPVGWDRVDNSVDGAQP